MIILESPDGAERVLILQRPDGAFTYRMQRRAEALQPASDDEEGWSSAGPDCGIYDAMDTAETEARQRVPWLKAQFH